MLSTTKGRNHITTGSPPVMGSAPLSYTNRVVVI
jgi:hypothetical protein